MYSITKKQEISLKKSTKGTLPDFQVVLPLLTILLLVACGNRLIAYKGTCAQQTQQFLDYVYALVLDELTPVIEDGISLGPTPEVMTRIEELNARISKLNTPECNPRTQTVKDALLLYVLETRKYFTIVAGRGVYGEGPVQGQWTKMYEAGFAFEKAFVDLRK